VSLIKPLSCNSHIDQSKKSLSMFGISLIEMVIFIVLVGIIATGLMAALHESLKHLPENQDDIVAIHLAESRLEFLIGQKFINDFSHFTDTCTDAEPPSICSVPSGYTVTSTITRGYESDPNLGTIRVVVTGKGRAEVETLIGNTP
jgi:hypothetical protein